jgi:hypothetical protein
MTLDRDGLLLFFGSTPAASVASFTSFCADVPRKDELD